MKNHKMEDGCKLHFFSVKIKFFIRLTNHQSVYGDNDHMGETINLVENFKVEKVIFNCGEFNELEQQLIKELDKKKYLIIVVLKNKI